MVRAELVGRILRELRKSKKLSQEVLSGLAGLDRTHYSKIERGLRNPTVDTLFKLAYAHGMRPNELVLLIERAVQEEQENE